MIRPFQAGDRAAIRRICCETGDKGDPVESFFLDREIFSDLVTRYYTDFEPNGIWVVESDGQVVGYLTGTYDSGRYWRAIRRRVIPSVILQGILRGTFLQRQTWRLLWAGLQTFLLGGLRKGPLLDEYPAHFHIDLLKEFRGRDLGRELVKRFEAEVSRRGVKGIHLVTRADNTAGRRFFEQLGFTELGRRPVVRPVGAGYEADESVIYGKKVPDASMR